MLEAEDGKLRPAIANLIFSIRPLLVLLFIAATVFFGYQASNLKPDASFEKMVPVSHPYIINYLDNKADLAALGNAVRITVQTREGDIFTAEFQELLRTITDEVFYVRGVDRSALQSLWTPNVRWQEVTEEGFVGGSVIPDDYDASERSLQKLRQNTLKSGQVGRLVANDFKSATILAPLVEVDPETGEKLDYHLLSEDLERLVREKYQSDTIEIRITGFAKLVGDLIDGAILVGAFFGIAFLITAFMLYLYSRCHWCTLVPLVCSTAAVVWQLGLLETVGLGIDPYSMLVPFLVFAIGISHSVQMINRFGEHMCQGMEKRDAAWLTFVRLSKPGFIALVSDGVGFFTLSVIDIPVIRELAWVASSGVAILILTNLILLPVLLSYAGISNSCRKHRKGKENSGYGHWQAASKITIPSRARIVVVIGIVLAAIGFIEGRDQKIGDLDAGAPELRPDARYNQDTAYLAENYSTSTDVFVVMVETNPQECGIFEAVSSIDYFQGVMEQVPGVQSAMSLVDISKLVIMGMNEGSPQWHTISRNRYILNNSLSRVPSDLLNTDCSMVPVILFLEDHKADTLTRVINAVETFAEEHDTDGIEYKLAAGNAGVEAATNIVISEAQYRMLAWVYGVVILLCLLTFRSLRITACIILPLMLTSLLGQALMTWLGIGVKVATLPVIALGVGIGVDYGIYIYSALQHYLNHGYSLREGYFEALKSSGTAVAFTGLTLAAGVATWIFSPIKFQADMGLLLTFMFFWNMLGAILLLPALASVLGIGQAQKNQQ
ncbi:MAG: RND family transporter [Halioglobus sp.]|nr:RND family transporter [Halioglobus sp.]